MTIELRTVDDVAVVLLDGSIDGRTAPLVEARIGEIPATARSVLINMTKVDFLSSAGLRLLLLMYRQIKARGGQIALVGVSDDIQDVMTNTGFRQFFIVVDSEERALASLREQAR